MRDFEGVWTHSPPSSTYGVWFHRRQRRRDDIFTYNHYSGRVHMHGPLLLKAPLRYHEFRMHSQTPLQKQARHAPPEHGTRNTGHRQCCICPDVPDLEPPGTPDDNRVQSLSKQPGGRTTLTHAPLLICPSVTSNSLIGQEGRLWRVIGWLWGLINMICRVMRLTAPAGISAPTPPHVPFLACYSRATTRRLDGEHSSGSRPDQGYFRRLRAASPTP